MIVWNLVSDNKLPPIDTTDKWNQEEKVSAQILIYLISKHTQSHHTLFGHYFHKTKNWSYSGFTGKATVIAWSEINQPMIGVGAPVLETLKRDVSTMSVKVSTPKDTLSEVNLTTVEKLIVAFEQEMLEEESDQQYYHLVIQNEFPRPVLDEIEKRYKAAGWAKVKCGTTSEDNERPGLTGLQLWRQ